MKSLALLTLAVFVIGCSGDATKTTTATPTGAAEVTTVSCAACGTQVASKEAVDKDGKKMCSACASH